MVCSDRQRVCKISPDFCDSRALGGGWVRFFQLQRLAIFCDSFFESVQPAISKAKLVMNIGQLRLQFRCATGMISSLGVSFLLKATLCHHDVGLPRVRVFGEIVRPKRLFVAINVRADESVCTHRANQQGDNGCGGNFGCALPARRSLGAGGWPPPRVCDARAEECDQRNVSKILEMIGDERAAAHVSHSDKSKHWEKRDNKAGNRKKSAACATIPPVPQAGQDGYERNHRQPFQSAWRIKSPAWINGHQSNRGEEMRGVPPYCRCSVRKAARQRPDHDLFFTNAAVLKPHRDQAQNNRE